MHATSSRDVEAQLHVPFHSGAADRPASVSGRNRLGAAGWPRSRTFRSRQLADEGVARSGTLGFLPAGPPCVNCCLRVPAETYPRAPRQTRTELPSGATAPLPNRTKPLGASRSQAASSRSFTWGAAPSSPDVLHASSRVSSASLTARVAVRCGLRFTYPNVERRCAPVRPRAGPTRCRTWSASASNPPFRARCSNCLPASV